MKNATYNQGIGRFIIYQTLTKVSECRKKKECIDIPGGHGSVVRLNTILSNLKYCSVILHYIRKCTLAF